jgi:hypothetical protein
MPNAALPTDLIVKAENKYGNIAPKSNPAKMSARLREIAAGSA